MLPGGEAAGVKPRFITHSLPAYRANMNLGISSSFSPDSVKVVKMLDVPFAKAPTLEF